MAQRMICLGDKGKEADRGGLKSMRLKDVADLSGRYLSFEGGVLEVVCLCARGTKGMIGDGEIRDALVAKP